MANDATNREPRQRRGRRVLCKTYHIRIHENSSVNQGDLETELQKILQIRADEAGEALTLKANVGNPGVVYVLAPKGVARPGREELARRKMKQAIDQARRAGLDPRELIT